jgi:hypothetical protein
MRLHQLTIAAAVLLISTHAAAQEWLEYTSRQDRFSVNFPAAPMIRELSLGAMQSCRHASHRGAWAPVRVITGSGLV